MRRSRFKHLLGQGGEPEVGDLEVAGVVDEEVIWLDNNGSSGGRIAGGIRLASSACLFSFRCYGSIARFVASFIRSSYSLDAHVAARIQLVLHGRGCAARMYKIFFPCLGLTPNGMHAIGAT